MKHDTSHQARLVSKAMSVELNQEVVQKAIRGANDFCHFTIQCCNGLRIVLGKREEDIIHWARTSRPHLSERINTFQCFVFSIFSPAFANLM